MNNKLKIKIALCLMILLVLFNPGSVLGRGGDYRISWYSYSGKDFASVYYWEDFNWLLSQLRGMGYSCVHDDNYWKNYKFVYNGVTYYDDLSPYNFNVCTKTTYINSTTYNARKDDYRTLTGVSAVVSTPSKYTLEAWWDSPFIYIQNAPQGQILVSLVSQFNKYSPNPSFNEQSGWLLDSQDGKLTLDGKSQDKLFYELEISKLTLNRNGKNFSSKEDLTQYLQNSDFLTKLGFTDEQKKNSLGYFLPKLNETENKNFYYLTILSDQSITEISQLSIKPTPKEIIRQYFAVYPTNVEVKSTGNFIFPEKPQIDATDFTAKETGEFLVQKGMQVFFE